MLRQTTWRIGDQLFWIWFEFSILFILGISLENLFGYEFFSYSKKYISPIHAGNENFEDSLKSTSSIVAPSSLSLSKE